MTPFTPPEFLKPTFHCPHCKAYSQQHWFDINGHSNTFGGQRFENLRVSACTNCSKECIWLNEAIIFPRTRGAPPPNPDLSVRIKSLYEEAAKIEHESPRAAAALLRLCLQLICIELGENGKNINADIASLVAKGLPIEVQRALDVLRVIGNNAVHPGEISLEDQPETVTALFTLVNTVADRMITQPKKVAELYDTLPPSVREAIAKRDGSPP